MVCGVGGIGGVVGMKAAGWNFACCKSMGIFFWGDLVALGMDWV